MALPPKLPSTITTPGIHTWYSFVLSFPPSLVENYITRFDLHPGAVLLDPFCGTGTTLVTSKILGIPSVGIESNPMAHFASSIKVSWDISPQELKEHARDIACEASKRLASDGLSNTSGLPLFGSPKVDCASLRSFSATEKDLIQQNAVSPIPLHKLLVLRDVIAVLKVESLNGHELLALAKTAVAVSNLRFGPEVGLGAIKDDAAVVETWLSAVEATARDLSYVSGKKWPSSLIYDGDSRESSTVLGDQRIDAVITSPPYPNEKDYTRTTRLESVLLGMIRDKKDLRMVKQRMLRSNSRGVFKADTDDTVDFPIREIDELAVTIESRRVALGKTSGFERLYSRLTRLYFGGMLRHLSDLRGTLTPGARLAYVVGDQASYFQVMIQTGQLIAKLAQALGYEIEGIDLFRTRAATATRQRLREEVVLLKWPG